MKNSALENCNYKVAIIGRLDQPGGVQSVMLSLIKGLNKIGIIPDIIWDLPPGRNLLEERGVLAGFLPVTFKFSSRVLDRVPVTVRYLLRAFDTLSDEQVERVHRYDFYYIFYNGFLMKTGVPHLRYLNGPPLLPQLDTYSPGIRGLPYRFFRQLYRLFLRKRFPVYEYHRDSNYVINSSYTQDLFAGAHGVRLPIINPPVIIQRHPLPADDFASRKNVTFFSRFASYKRPEMVLTLASRHPDRQFLLMGGVKTITKAYYQSLQEQAARLNLKNVRFIETPSIETIRSELLKTRFYIFPAINEHFGMTTVEAISLGAVPFVHDSGGQREIVPDSILRFQDETFIDQFDRLIQMSPSDLANIRERLMDHIQQFSEEAFHSKMLSYLPFQFLDRENTVHEIAQAIQ